MLKLPVSSLFVILLLNHSALAQDMPLQFGVEVQTTVTTRNTTPFWIRSNQYGSIPLPGASASFIGRAKRGYTDSEPDGYFGRPKIIDWGMGFEGRVNTNSKTNQFILTEAYLKGRLGPFELKAGRSKETMGLTGDTALTSGSFAVSGNALGIPKIELSIPNYYSLPFWNKLFSIKGNFGHGWMGKVRITDTISGANPGDGNLILLSDYPETFFHQKSFYARLGRPEWRIKLFGGFNHQVFWGSEKEAYGERFDISPAETFFYYVITGFTYGDGKNNPKSKIGNQLGSIDMGLEYDFDDIKLSLYRQNFYDVGALYYLANLRDGLNGIALTNKRDPGGNFGWKKIVFEFLYTKNQAGELWSKYTKSGDEDYYNNYYYVQGWSYKAKGIGTPFISPKTSVRPGMPSDPDDYFINNRVIGFHFGLTCNVNNWHQLVKISYSRNFGTFGTDEVGHTTGKNRIPPKYGFFTEVGQFSAYWEGRRNLTKNGLQIKYAAALDQGNLLPNSFAGSLSLSKIF